MLNVITWLAACGLSWALIFWACCIYLIDFLK